MKIPTIVWKEEQGESKLSTELLGYGVLAIAVVTFIMPLITVFGSLGIGLYLVTKAHEQKRQDRLKLSSAEEKFVALKEVKL